MISKLRKLRGRSLGEIVHRGRQKAGVLAERLGASLNIRIPSDEQFFTLFLGIEISSSDQLFEYFSGLENRFFPGLDNRDQTTELLHSRFPDAASKAIRKADRICEGRFDPLGYKNISFGGQIPDWHLDPVSVKRSPMHHWSEIGETNSSETGDKKIVWELNRHQYFVTLGQACWLTSDEKYCHAFVSHIEDWIESNPPKLGVNWMSSLEVAFRSISWIWAFHFFRDSPAFTHELLVRMLKTLYLNGRHIEKHLSTYSSPNTHLTGEGLGLYIVGSFFQTTEEGAAWKNLGYGILIDCLDYQIRNDGGYVEQSTAYHRYTADFYLALFILRKAEGLPIDKLHQDNLRKMLRFLMYVTQPGGRTPLIGDDDGGRLHFLDDREYDDFRSTLTVGAALLGDRELKFCAGKPTAELLWLTGPEGLADFERLEPAAPVETSKAFEESGFYAFRDGWSSDANFVLIDCGEHGFRNGGHAHADALSFVLSVNGQSVLVDSGTFCYTTDKKERDYFRSSAAHNCLIVNDQSSSVPDGPFSWKSVADSKVLEWSIGKNDATVVGTHGGYERFSVKYTRKFHFVHGESLTVSDQIDNSSGNDFQLVFVLSSKVEAEICEKSSAVLRSKVGKKKLLTVNTRLIPEIADCGWRVEKAWISPRYGSRIETTKLVFSVTAGCPFTIESKLIFSKDN